MTPSISKERESIPVSVGIISLGCSKNLVDSQVMVGELLTGGVTIAPSPEEADVVLVNTCAFIEAAREESVETILYACGLKKSGPCRAVLVTGCMPQRYRDELQESLPEVDAFIGVDELDKVNDVVHRIREGEHGIMRVSAEAQRVFEAPVPGLALTGGPYAYLKIADGCNHRCAYCAIPGIRGRARSRAMSSILKEAEALLEQGFSELNLISQDVTAYGKDLDEGAGLAELLRALAGIGGDFWLRVLYGYPTFVTNELLETMAGLPQVCHYLDIPIQHASPDVLRRMNRAGTETHLRRMVRRAREIMPDVTLRTTCLIGFPGETDQDFDKLLEFVCDARFDHLGSFAFSPEDGTPAAAMANHVPEDVITERVARLMAAQRGIVEEKAQGLVGHTDRVLLEHAAGEPGCWIGRAARQAPDVDGITVIGDVPDGAGTGDIVPVTYSGYEGYDMLAGCTTEGSA